MKSEPYEAHGQNIDIEACGSCGKSHTNVEINAFERQRPECTHYYHCPKTKDPVSLCIRQYGANLVEVGAKCVESLVAAEMTGSFLVAVFYPEAGGKIRCDRHAWNISTDSFPSLVKALDDNLRKETHAPARANIKPAAAPAAPVPLFGEASQ